MRMLKVDHLYKSYQTGKTTLLNCISCFIPYDKGTISLKDVNLSKLDEKQIVKVRNEKLGFVFQDFMLLDGLTILENVCVPKVIRKEPCKQMESKAKKLLKMFGISEIAGKYPAEISGGQKQRTAVARALMNDPLLILADEAHWQSGQPLQRSCHRSIPGGAGKAERHHLHGDSSQFFRQLLRQSHRDERWKDIYRTCEKRWQERISR